VFDADVVPLVVSDAPRTDQDHWSATLAVTGRRDERAGWHHPPGSPLAAWVKRAGRAPVVYLQPGDGPSAFDHPTYRRLLANALTWAASGDAASWAAHGQP
jgi:type 1 glutamine amidotransferase